MTGVYYYDFDGERKLTSWQEISRNGEKVLAKCVFECEEEGDFILLWEEQRYYVPDDPLLFTLCGKDVTKIVDFYIAKFNMRHGLRQHFVKGENTILCELIPGECGLEGFTLSLIGVEKAVPAAKYKSTISFPAKEYPAPVEDISIEGMRKGAGFDNNPGRFGFVKAAGFLDCAMSQFGSVNKMFLCGDPKYKKPYLWGYSLLQEESMGVLTKEEEEKYDEYKVTSHMAINWKRGRTSFLASVGFGGIVTEYDAEKADDPMKITRLEFAGNYQYILTAGEVASLGEFSGVLPENFFLLFGSTEYPDIPLLVIVDTHPSKVEFLRNKENRLSSVLLYGCRRMTTLTPFGFESLDKTDPADNTFLADALERCRFWSRVSLAVPVNCKEYYSNDHREKVTRIVQKFEYKTYTDAWNTAPLYIAPLPPVLALGCEDKLPEGASDFHYPTKYGPFCGYYGTNSSYTVKMLPSFRKFPLREKDSEAEKILADGLEDYFEFESRFPDTWQSYAYPGAILESYAYTASMFNFMPEEKREFLAKELKKRIDLACDPERKYTLLLTDHHKLIVEEPPREEVEKYYKDPSRIRTMQMYNLYERKEPFTGKTYYLCYFNVSNLFSGVLKTGTREEVLAYPHPFVENDWGIGISMYMLYSAALTCGDFSGIRKQWKHIQKIFRYFHIYHDWACMGAGYAEKAWCWLEGANFGAFPAFINMAKAVGDMEAYENAQYISAKMLCLSRARFRNGEYFAKYYHVPAWYGARYFYEEHSPRLLFQCVPDQENDFWYDKESGALRIGISLLTTDAIYPELFESFRITMPEKHRFIMDKFRKKMDTPFMTHKNDRSYLLVNDALDPLVPEETVRKNLASTIKMGKLLTQWHDINRFENNMPERYLESQIIAWLEMRSHGLYLEDWHGIRIMDALWDQEKRKAVIQIKYLDESAFLRCGLNGKVKKISFNSAEITAQTPEENIMEFSFNNSGTLEVEF